MWELQRLEPQPPTPSRPSNQQESEEPQMQPQVSNQNDNDSRQSRPEAGLNAPIDTSRAASPGASRITSTCRKSSISSRILLAWRRHISPSVDHAACRDHLALERTFLGYLRTSVWLANFGVLIAQLFSLQRADSGFGYARVGKPLATVCFAAAIATVSLGIVRVWRYQAALIRGKVLSGGVELMLLGVGLLAIECAFFGLVLAIEIFKEREGASD